MTGGRTYGTGRTTARSHTSLCTYVPPHTTTAPQLNHEQVAFQRRYISYIKRCDELERKLRYIRGEIAKFGLDTEVRAYCVCGRATDGCMHGGEEDVGMQACMRVVGWDLGARAIRPPRPINSPIT